MKIAIDFDGTYNSDPELWDAVIRLLQKSNKVCLVTFRDEVLDWDDLMTHLEDDMGVTVYCTGGVAKAWWMAHFGDGVPDIWIDDNPSGIYNNSSLGPMQLKEWRSK